MFRPLRSLAAPFGVVPSNVRRLGRLIPSLLLVCSIPASSLAQGTTGTWKFLSGPKDPRAMIGPIVVHDATRHRLLAFSGTEPDELWSLSLPDTGRLTWRRVPIGGPLFPPGRALPAAVLDAPHDRIVMVGGISTEQPPYGSWSLSLNDVWALCLGDSLHWEQLAPSGPSPSPREQAAAAFDSARDRMLIFGGSVNASAGFGPFLSEVWALDLAAEPRWEPIVTSGPGPTPRKGASAVYDPVTDLLFLFGGFNMGPGSPFDDTWALSFAGTPTWTRILVSATPGGRQELVTVLDPDRRRLILTGGNCAQWSHGTTDTWELPLAAAAGGLTTSWSQIITTGDNPPVDLHGGIYSPERHTLIQFGGEHGWGESDELDLSTSLWRRIDSEAPEEFPAQRAQSVLMPQADSGEFLMFGGNAAGCKQDLWSFADGRTAPWVPVPVEGIAPGCQSYEFIHDVARDRLLCVDAGYFNNWPTNDFVVWELSLHGTRSWTQLVDSGSKPPGRTWFSVAFDTRRNRLLMSGGESFHGHEYYGEFQDDLWAYSLDDHSWSELLPLNSPGPHEMSWMGYDARNDQLILSGGGDPRYGDDAAKRFDCWRLPLGGDSLRWQRLPDAPTWRPLAIDSLRNRLLAWNGGQSVAALSLNEPDNWSPLALLGESPTPRTDAAVAYDMRNDRLILYGGLDGGFRGDAYALNLSQLVAVSSRGWVRPAIAPSEPRGRPARRLEIAVHGAPGFDVGALRLQTVTFAGAHLSATNGTPDVVRRDVDGDGYIDLLMHFPIDSLVIPAGDRVTWLLAARSGQSDIRGAVDVQRLGIGSILPGVTQASARVALSMTRPSGEGLELVLTLISNTPARIEVFDVAGRRLLEQAVPSPQPGVQQLHLGREALPSGFYVVRLRQDGSSAIARAIVL